MPRRDFCGKSWFLIYMKMKIFTKMLFFKQHDRLLNNNNRKGCQDFYFFILNHANPQPELMIW